MMFIVVFTLAPIQVYGGGRIGWDQYGRRPLVADSLMIETKIREQIAYTTVRQVFRNPGDVPSVAVYGYALPQDAVVTDIRWSAGGQWHLSDTLRSSVLMLKDRAIHRLDEFARSFGLTPFTQRIADTVAAHQLLVVEIVYTEMLKKSQGSYTYTFPYGPSGDAGRYPIDQWIVDIRSDRKIEHPTFIGSDRATVGGDSTSVFFTINGEWATPRPMGCTYALRNEDLLVNVISTKRAGEDGYALILVDPESTADSGDVMPKRFTFIVDHSLSMAGERMDQAKEAAEYCIRRLNQGDLLSVIKFNSYAETWTEEHLRVNHENTELAAGYIQGIRPTGGTDIMKALSLALNRHHNDAYVNVIIFLTDGQADVDHRAIRHMNTSSTRIFVFGVGDEVNEGDLIRIAANNKGTATFIRKASDITVSVSALFNRINDPLVTDPVLDFVPRNVHSIVPGVAPDLYRGEQLLLVGRYAEPGETMLTISGTDKKGPVAFTYAAHLSDDPLLNGLVSKIWARQRLTVLMEKLKSVKKEDPQYDLLTRELASLGHRHGFVTPSTEFVKPSELVEEDDEGGAITPPSISVMFAQERCRVTYDPEVRTMYFEFELQDIDLRNVRVEILDRSGKPIVLLADVPIAPGRMKLTWPISDQQGEAVPAGEYVLSLQANGVRSTRMVRLTD